MSALMVRIEKDEDGFVSVRQALPITGNGQPVYRRDARRALRAWYEENLDRLVDLTLADGMATVIRGHTFTCDHYHDDECSCLPR